jgi:hypothetical protein
METPTHRSILDKKIAEGAAQAGRVIETIFNDVPTDQIVRAASVVWKPTDKGIAVNVGDSSLVPSDHALNQVAERAGVPAIYVRQLVKGEVPSGEVHEGVLEGTDSDRDWKRELAADILTRHYSHGNGRRVLVRSVRGQLRGWLSDKFRRLDDRPLVEALVEEAQALGAIPIDGVATETRTAIKVILPTIEEPVPGEFLVYGGEHSNSNYGNGTHSFRLFGLRVACLNGMTRENLFKQIHLGGKLSDDIVFSQKTYELDTAASVSALRDIVRHGLGPAGRQSLTEKIQAANAQQFSKAKLLAAVKNVPKAQQKTIVDAYESEDVINLPAGQTAWRASNAVSWVARHTKDAEAKLDLERVAGALAA